MQARNAAGIALWVLAAGLASAAAATDQPLGFEIPPELQPAALVSPDLVVGANYHIVDPVHDDGLMPRFVIDSKFGQFEAYGKVALALRLHEVAALTELSKISPVEVFAGGVTQGVQSQVHTAVGVVAHPIKTISGVPKGIANLFKGYTDESKEALAGVTASSGADEHGGASETLGKAGTAAQHYAAQYLGVSAAEMRWYQKLRVDPYTDNQTLRKAVRDTARVEAAAGFGMKFVGIPGIPGIGQIREVMDAIYKEDPATIRARNKTALAGYGLSAAEIERFQNAALLSPTRQNLLLAAAKDLDAVDGRKELFLHALGLSSAEEAQVYLQSVGLLVLTHKKQPLQSILPGVRLPAALRADGHVIVCGAFEGVYWTRFVADGEQEIRQLLPADAPARELVLAGSASARARSELGARGWTVVESQLELATADGKEKPE